MLYLSGDHDGALAALAKARQLGDNTPGNWFLTAIMLDGAHRSQPAAMKQAIAAYRKFLSFKRQAKVQPGVSSAATRQNASKGVG